MPKISPIAYAEDTELIQRLENHQVIPEDDLIGMKQVFRDRYLVAAVKLIESRTAAANASAAVLFCAALEMFPSALEYSTRHTPQLLKRTLKYRFMDLLEFVEDAQGERTSLTNRNDLADAAIAEAVQKTAINVGFVVVASCYEYGDKTEDIVETRFRVVHGLLRTSPESIADAWGDGSRTQLTRNDIKILGALNNSIHPLIYADIEAATEISVSACKKIVPQLERQGLVARPDGPRSGYSITDAGRSAI